MDELYLWIVKRRNPIVRIFVIVNCALALVWLIAYRAVVLGEGNPIWFYENATLFGKTAIILYILTTIPGIFRRFGKFYKPVSLLMIFRRYIGIMTFMLVFIHGTIELFKYFPLLLFEYFGIIAFLLLLSLFITSNDWSVNNMGKWWHTIHNLTYVIVGFIFVHVALQEINIWSILIGLDALAILVSFLVSRRRSTIRP